MDVLRSRVHALQDDSIVAASGQSALAAAPGTRHPAPGTRHPAPGTRTKSLLDQSVLSELG